MCCSAGTDIYSLSMAVSVVGLPMAQLADHCHVSEKGDKVDTDWKTQSHLCLWCFNGYAMCEYC